MNKGVVSSDIKYFLLLMMRLYLVTSEHILLYYVVYGFVLMVCCMICMESVNMVNRLYVSHVIMLMYIFLHIKICLST